MTQDNNFIAVFGAHCSKEDVLADAEREGLVPQSYVLDCVLEAQKQGLAGDPYEIAAELTKELGLPLS